MHLQSINMQLRHMLQVTQEKLHAASAKEMELSRADSDVQSIQSEKDEAVQGQRRLEGQVERLTEEKRAAEVVTVPLFPLLHALRRAITPNSDLRWAHRW
jgi:hypothetical protein